MFTARKRKYSRVLTMGASRYVQCISCGNIMSWLSHSLLKCSVPCSDCGAKDQFGPGVYVEDYKGVTLAQAMIRRMSILRNPDVIPIGWQRKGYQFIAGEWRAP